jgi:hypothetical protein
MLIRIRNPDSQAQKDHQNKLAKNEPVLMCGPLELCGIGMSRAHVLGLEVLHLGQDVVAVRHF